jgi:hypothetical protein
LKRQFRILLLTLEYSMEIQARIPAALCVIHNFICIHDPADKVIVADNGGDHNDNLFDHEHIASASAAAEIDEPSARRDRIADMMWADYLAVLRERENERYSSNSDDNNRSADVDKELGDDNK